MKNEIYGIYYYGEFIGEVGYFKTVVAAVAKYNKEEGSKDAYKWGEIEFLEEVT